LTEGPGAVEGAPIALCGFMGSGKSTVGRRVAHALRRGFFDSDELVEARLGRTVVDLFSHGEEKLFRATEAQVIAEIVAHRPSGVLSLGGGALEDLRTRSLVFGETVAVHLDRPLSAILASLERLQSRRPLLVGRTTEEITELYRSRTGAFAHCPITVAVEDHDVNAVVGLVLERLVEFGVTPTDTEEVSGGRHRPN
jgi:shikimate kinase